MAPPPKKMRLIEEGEDRVLMSLKTERAINQEATDQEVAKVCG